MKSKRKSFVVGIISLMILSLSGVYGVYAGGEQEKEAVTTIEQWSFRTEMEPQGQHLMWVKEGFEAEHPNIKVNLVWAGQNLLQKVRPRLVAGNPPDVVVYNQDGIDTLIKEGLLYPLDELMNKKAYDQDILFKDTFVPLVLESTMAVSKGKYYCAPRDVTVAGFFYNTKMFEDLGLKIPKTWSEFLNVCKVLKNNGIAPLSQDGTISFYNEWYFLWFATRLVGAERVLATALNEPGTSWKESEFLQAAKLVKDLRDKGYFVEGFEGSAYPGSQVDWAQEKTAMIFCGSWLPNEVSNVMPEGFQLGMFPFPMIEGGKGVFSIELWVFPYVIPKDAAHKLEAIEFIRYATSKKVASEQVASAGIPCGVRGITNPIDGMGEMIERADKIVPIKMGLSAAAGEWLTNIFEPLDDSLIWGRITPQEFIERLDEKHRVYYEVERK